MLSLWPLIRCLTRKNIVKKYTVGVILDRLVQDDGVEGYTLTPPYKSSRITKTK